MFHIAVEGVEAKNITLPTLPMRRGFFGFCLHCLHSVDVLLFNGNQNRLLVIPLGFLEVVDGVEVSTARDVMFLCAVIARHKQATEHDFAPTEVLVADGVKHTSEATGMPEHAEQLVCGFKGQSTLREGLVKQTDEDLVGEFIVAPLVGQCLVLATDVEEPLELVNLLAPVVVVNDCAVVQLHPEVPVEIIESLALLVGEDAVEMVCDEGLLLFGDGVLGKFGKNSVHCVLKWKVRCVSVGRQRSLSTRQFFPNPFWSLDSDSLLAVKKWIH